MYEVVIPPHSNHSYYDAYDKSMSLYHITFLFLSGSAVRQPVPRHIRLVSKTPGRTPSQAIKRLSYWVQVQLHQGHTLPVQWSGVGSELLP